MDKHYFSIEGIPSLLWGPATGRLLLAIHGDQSHKEDTVIGILAEEAAFRGWQVLSIDLPEHGGRKTEPRLCNPQNCVADLQKVMRYARLQGAETGFFGCSIGAYFGMMAFHRQAVAQTLLLSPVVDMERLIRNIMLWTGVSEERLEKEKEIATPVKTLYWDYFRYVAEHPVEWDKPTALLYGEKDELCEYAVVRDFADKTGAEMTVLENGEHFFHTEEQLAFYRQWLKENIR